jgi:LCP family protein required for cell wall assembly
MEALLSISAAQQHTAREERSQPPLWLKLLIGLFLVVFAVGGLYSGYLFYATVREIVAGTDLPALPVIQLPSINLPNAQADEDVVEPLPEMGMVATPVVGAGDMAYVPPPAPPLVEGERTNILLLGIDRRGGKSWNHLTDTIIIVSVDQVNNTVSMMSIPRDLYLEIPGYGESRINVANRYGYSYDYPGGGPALLKRTIEQSFEIPIDYYVMVDFDGFTQVIDTLGGIDVNVPRTLHDTMYPDPRPGDPYAYKTIHFDAGWQHLDGKRALEYSRSRMSTSDFARAQRQQKVLLAIREKAVSLGVLNLIPKLPALFATMGNMVKTDMTLGEMGELAQLAPQINLENIETAVIQKPLVYGYRTETGAAVQLPKWDLIRPLVDEMFKAPVVAAAPTPVPTQPAPPTPTPTLAPVQIEGLQRLADEGARIAIQNGTSEPNFAARVAASLMEQGFQVVEFGDADRTDYPNTVLVDYTGKNYTLERLVDMFQVASENVRYSPNLRSQIDIRIVVGQDFVLLFPQTP